MKYRAEIDGLRAIAVIGVILYHAQFMLFGHDWFEGGYIGVDIFFVISGYLISRIILNELFEHDRFNFGHFYERRARRILPMLFTVVIVVFPVAWFTLLPANFVEYSLSSLSALLFGSNFFFYYATTEYGAQSALLKPFLHTWSLGIEEQFYIVFPLLVVALHKWLKDSVLIAFVVLFLASLQFAQIMSAIDPELNFYWPLSRFWELLAGSILAYIELKYGRVARSPLTQAMSFIGLYLIISSIFLLNGDSPHPGLITLLPIIGVMLIIAFSSNKDVVGRILGSRAFVGVGLISYSLYLWHFPIFAFGRIYVEKVENTDRVIWLVACALLSLLSYLIIERPFRNPKIIGRRVFIGSHLFLFIALVGIMTSMAMSTLDYKNLHLLAKARPIINADQKAFMEQWYYYKEKGIIAFDAQNAQPKILIVGDSTATDLYRALSSVEQSGSLYNLAIIQHEDVRSMYQVDCFYRYVAQGDYTCTSQSFIGAAKDAFDTAYRHADIIVVVARWEETDIDVLPVLISKLKEQGKRVIIASNMPELSYGSDDKLITPLSAFLLKHRRMPDAKEELKEIESEVYERVSTNDKVFITNTELEIIAEEQGALFLKRTYVMCDEQTERCDVLTPDGDIVMFDLSHISYAATLYYGQNLIHKTQLLKMLEE